MPGYRLFNVKFLLVAFFMLLQSLFAQEDQVQIQKSVAEKILESAYNARWA